MVHDSFALSLDTVASRAAGLVRKRFDRDGVIVRKAVGYNLGWATVVVALILGIGERIGQSSCVFGVC